MNTEDIQALGEQLGTKLATALAAQGISQLAKHPHPGLLNEAKHLALALAADKPEDIDDRALALACFSAGFAFAHNTAKIESQGGFEAIIEAAGGERELGNLLISDGPQAVEAKLRAATQS